MSDELVDRATQIRNDAQDLRRKGRKEPDPDARKELFDGATAELQKAITALERGLRTLRRQQSGFTPDVCRVLEALSQSYGSLGGTWRDAGNRDQARQWYDKGNEYEEERRKHCGALDTYNMLQRLIVRLLDDPSRIGQPEFVAELGTVRDEIERQVKAGRTDSWALADRALARFLSGAEANDAIENLERGTADAAFYESAYNAVGALVDEGLGRGAELGKRLELFRRLLQRKGGLA
jgi:hypothetical protein